MENLVLSKTFSVDEAVTNIQVTSEIVSSATFDFYGMGWKAFRTLKVSNLLVKQDVLELQLTLFRYGIKFSLPYLESITFYEAIYQIVAISNPKIRFKRLSIYFVIGTLYKNKFQEIS